MTEASTPSINRRTLLRGSVTLAGVAVVLPSMASLSGCTSTPPSLTAYGALIEAVVDRIIPATKTPGAVEAGVPQYIAALFEQHLDAAQQGELITALEAIETRTRAEGHTSFAAASADQRDGVLTQVANERQPGWQALRDMAIFGFYTSETATEELAYEEIPGRYNGCVPLAEIGSAWLERGV